MLLFKRLPLTSRPSAGIVEREPEFDLPVLSGRLDTLERVVAPEFERLDQESLREQIRHRRLELLALLLAALMSIFGAVQATGANWTGAVIAGVGLVAAAVTRYTMQSAPMSKYLDSRARAEELRSLYFRYLGGVDGDDEAELEARVLQIVDPLHMGEAAP